jgi:hypothetical protein
MGRGRGKVRRRCEGRREVEEGGEGADRRVRVLKARGKGGKRGKDLTFSRTKRSSET